MIAINLVIGSSVAMVLFIAFFFLSKKQKMKKYLLSTWRLMRAELADNIDTSGISEQAMKLIVRINKVRSERRKLEMVLDSRG